MWRNLYFYVYVHLCTAKRPKRIAHRFARNLHQHFYTPQQFYLSWSLWPSLQQFFLFLTRSWPCESLFIAQAICCVKSNMNKVVPVVIVFSSIRFVALVFGNNNIYKGDKFRTKFSAQSKNDRRAAAAKMSWISKKC